MSIEAVTKQHLADIKGFANLHKTLLKTLIRLNGLASELTDAQKAEVQQLLLDTLQTIEQFAFPFIKTLLDTEIKVLVPYKAPEDKETLIQHDLNLAVLVASIKAMSSMVRDHQRAPQPEEYFMGSAQNILTQLYKFGYDFEFEQNS